jgi:hypothetical protein
MYRSKYLIFIPYPEHLVPGSTFKKTKVVPFTNTGYSGKLHFSITSLFILCYRVVRVNISPLPHFVRGYGGTFHDE